MTKKKAMGKDPFANRLSWIKDTQQDQVNNTTNESITTESSSEKELTPTNLEIETQALENKTSASSSSNDINNQKSTKVTGILANQEIIEDKDSAKNKTSSHKGLKDGWTRATLIIREDHLDMLKAVAYLERIDIKDLVESICNNYIETNSEQVNEALTLYLRKKK
jgi:hypothetical protein